MQVVKFPGSSNGNLYLNKFSSTIGTGAVGQRFEMLDALAEEFSEERMLAFSLSGCLDAPERIPTGQTVRRPHFPEHMVHTEPATVARA